MNPAPLRVVHVNLAFERTACLAELIARYRTLAGLCEAQAARGVRVHVLQRFWRDEDVTRAGVAYHARADGTARARPHPLTRCRSLWRLARELRPDVIHFNGLLFPLQLAALRQAVGPSPVCVVQDHGNTRGRLFERLAQRIVYRDVHAFFFTAEGGAAPWRREGIIRPGHRVFEVVEGSTRFRPRPPDDGAPAELRGTPAVLWVGRLTPGKDPLTAVQGFAQACAHLPDPHLFLIFERGDLLPEIERVCAGTPAIAGRVHSIGAVPHAGLEAWYNAADLFLTASRSEGCNYALVEAQACGLPAVCSDHPVHRRLTAGGALGALFPAGSAEGCARAIVSSAARAAAEGAGLRTRVRRHFEDVASWDAIARASIDAYRTLLDRPL